MTRRRFELIATAFDRKGRVITTATNQYTRSHPLMKRYSLLAGESEHKIFLHAEVACLLKAGETEVYSLLVQRFAANGNLALAMPCNACRIAIADFGVRYVNYSSPSGIVLMNV